MENDGGIQKRRIEGRRWLLFAGLLLGNGALSLGPWLVRLADTGPVAAGFWRVFLALPFIALFARASGQKLTGYAPRTLLLVAIAGVVFSLDLASWHVGILLTRAGNATLFGNSGSIVLMFWGFIMMRIMPQRREWLAIGAALGGAAILLGRSLEISTSTLIGDLFCLLAGMLYAGYLLILKDARGRLGGWSLLFWAGLAGSPVLLAIALVKGEPIWPHDWTPILILFVTSQLVGQGLLVFSLRHFSALVIGLALLTQPAVAALYGWLVFGEALGPLDISGMVLLGSALVLARESRSAQLSTPDQAGASQPATTGEEKT